MGLAVKTVVRRLLKVTAVLILGFVIFFAGVAVGMSPSTPAPPAAASVAVSQESTQVVRPPPATQPSPMATMAPTVVASPTPAPTATPRPTASSTSRLAVPTPTPTLATHRVQAGDTLRSIANQFGTTIERLMEANALDDPDLIRVGSILQIPGRTTATPLGVTWTVTSDAVRDGSNRRFVDVVLDQRVDEPTLRAIAQQIRQQSPDHPVVHILYYFDGMDTDAGAWATTRFEQDRPVEVRINDFLLTPTPTATPIRTARSPTQASECPTNAERRYLAALRKNIDEIGAGALLLAAVLSPLERNPEFILSDAFKIDFALTGAVIHGYANEILDRSRPGSSRLSQIHDRSRAMARSLKDGLDGMMRGFRLIDGAGIEAGVRHMQVTESRLLEINRLIDRLCQ